MMKTRGWQIYYMISMLETAGHDIVAREAFDKLYRNYTAWQPRVIVMGVAGSRLSSRQGSRYNPQLSLEI
jgi:hypothetical protein